METVDFLYLIIFSTSFIIAIVKAINWNRDNREVSEYYETKRKENIKKLYEGRLKRELLELFDADEFWGIIDESKNRSKESYKNQLGLLKDKFHKLTPEQLLKIDNLIIKLVKEAFTWELYGASTIIFKGSDTTRFHVFLSWLISRGEIIYNNALVNKNIILNQKFIDIDGRTISDIISEVYYKKTRTFIPIPDTCDINLQGEEWQEKDLPGRFSEIWDQFM